MRLQDSISASAAAVSTAVAHKEAAHAAAQTPKGHHAAHSHHHHAAAHHHHVAPSTLYTSQFSSAEALANNVSLSLLKLGSVSVRVEDTAEQLDCFLRG